jgi:polysaccharide biosynthesis/export protein
MLTPPLSNHGSLHSRLQVGLVTGLVVTSYGLGATPSFGVDATELNAQAAQSLATTVAPPSPSNFGYVLGAGDQVDIAVLGHQDLSGNRVVLPDGMINLPLLGAVMAAGKTPEELRLQVERQMKEYLVAPRVTLNLSTLRPVIVNVAGAVQRPGSIQMQSLTANTIRTGTTTLSSTPDAMPTISAALMQAGGVTQNADIRQVVLRRSMPGGEQLKLTVNLWDTIWSDQPSTDLALRPGDSIYIPELPAGAELDRRLMARSRLAPLTVRVRVVGEVTRPGEIQISPSSSLSSAIANAGGFTKEARPKEVQLVRLGDNGQIVAQKLDLSKLTDEIQVQEGDVLVVPEKSRSSVLRVVGQVLNPLGSLLNVLTRF